MVVAQERGTASVQGRAARVNAKHASLSVLTVAAVFARVSPHRLVRR